MKTTADTEIGAGLLESDDVKTRTSQRRIRGWLFVCGDARMLIPTMTRDGCSTTRGTCRLMSPWLQEMRDEQSQQKSRIRVVLVERGIVCSTALVTGFQSTILVEGTCWR